METLFFSFFFFLRKRLWWGDLLPDKPDIIGDLVLWLSLMFNSFSALLIYQQLDCFKVEQCRITEYLKTDWINKLHCWEGSDEILYSNYTFSNLNSVLKVIVNFFNCPELRLWILLFSHTPVFYAVFTFCMQIPSSPTPYTLCNVTCAHTSPCFYGSWTFLGWDL